MRFRPISEGYCDGDGGYSVMGWTLRQLGVEPVNLMELKSDKPFKELRTAHGIIFFDYSLWHCAVAPEAAESSADNLAAEIEGYQDRGKRDLASILLARLLREYECWLCKFVEEYEYLNIRVRVASEADRILGVKIFPKPLSA